MFSDVRVPRTVQGTAKSDSSDFVSEVIIPQVREKCKYFTKQSYAIVKKLRAMLNLMLF